MATAGTGATPADPILNLSTLVSRKYIEIDEHSYELRNIGDLSPLELARISDRFRLIDELEAKGAAATDREVKAVQQLLGEVCRLVVVELGVEVEGRLKPLQRAAIADCFNGRSRHGSPTASAPEIPATTPSRRVGASRQRASRGSTQGATSSAGSRRRSPSSTPRASP